MELAPGIKVDCLKAQAEPYLTEKAKERLAIRAMYMSAHTDGVLSHQCVYFGKKVDLSKIEDAVKTIAEKVNDLADKDLIHSTLSHFIKFDLSHEGTGYFNADGSPKEGMTVVLCYVLVPLETYQQIMDDMKKLDEELK